VELIENESDRSIRLLMSLSRGFCGSGDEEAQAEVARVAQDDWPLDRRIECDPEGPVGTASTVVTASAAKALELSGGDASRPLAGQRFFVSTGLDRRAGRDLDAAQGLNNLDAVELRPSVQLTPEDFFDELGTSAGIE
jgi:hypothetical protein